MKTLEVDITYTTENKDPVEFTVPHLLPNYEIIDFTFLTFNYFYKFSSPFMGGVFLHNEKMVEETK